MKNLKIILSVGLWLFFLPAVADSNSNQKQNLLETAISSWQVDTRVSAQVGVYYGPSGKAKKAPLKSYVWINQLDLPAGALLGNGISLPGTQPADIAQIDFYKLQDKDSQRLNLPQTFIEYLKEFDFPRAFEETLQKAVKAGTLLKEVRTRPEGEHSFGNELSALPKNKRSFLQDITYVSIFITKRHTNSEVSALQTLHDELKSQHIHYEVGSIVDLPPIPHPQNAAIMLSRLMTLRLESAKAQKQLVLEIIETR